MRYIHSGLKLFSFGVIAASLTACSTVSGGGGRDEGGRSYSSSYESRMPSHMNTGGRRMVLVDPNVHAWGAYDESGSLVRAGAATAGDSWCADINRPCKTPAGTYRIQSLGDGDCKSTRYPLPNGGGLMPYCMYFNKNMALHGSPSNAVVEDNISHGCVRMKIPDAEWMRHDFASIGTKVVIKAY